VVAADIFGDGHDVIVAVLRHRATGAPGGRGTHDLAGQRPLDRPVHGYGTRWHEYTIQAWVDRYLTGTGS